MADSSAARLMQVTPEEENRRASFRLNDNRPTFLQADPPVPSRPGACRAARFQW